MAAVVPVVAGEGKAEGGGGDGGGGGVEEHGLEGAATTTTGASEDEERRRGTVRLVNVDKGNGNGLKTAMVLLAVHSAFGMSVGLLVEDWDVLTTVYFCVVTLTTVGYGDLAPKTSTGRVMTAFYIIYAVLVLAWSLGSITEYIARRLESIKRQVALQQTQKIKAAVEYSMLSKVPYQAKAALFMGLFLTVGITFFIVAEGMSFADAFYFSIVTLSTVGYGDISLTSQRGRVFLIFYLILGTVLVTVAIGKSIDAFVEAKRRRLRQHILQKRFSLRELDAADADLSGSLTEAEFIVFKLQRMGLVQHQDLMKIQEQFRCFDIDGNGTITREEALATE